MKKYLFRNRRKIVVILLIAMFSVFFPYCVTLVNLDASNIKVYSPNLLGKSVMVKSGSQTVEMDVELFVPLVVYSMMPVKYEKNYNYTMKLLVETNGEVIYNDSKIICPYYHELSAGITNSGEEAYFKSVDSSVDKDSDGFMKIAYFTMDDMREKLKDMVSADISDEDLLNSIKVNYEENGEYAKTVSVGENVVLAQDWQQMFELPSTAFSVEGFSGGIKMTSKGIGDGKGLSINGTLKMAESETGYREILKHYFTDVEIR